jgi:polyhydroxybutyrate depolymerase
MKRLLIIAYVALLFFSSLGAAGESLRSAAVLRHAEDKHTAGMQECKLEHGGMTRTYRLHLPKDAPKNKPLPLVIVLHGASANGWITEALTGFDELADKHKFAVAYPDGVNSIWRFWSMPNPRAGGRMRSQDIDDVGFLTALMDYLTKEQIADRRRIYVTGISNGAYMTNRLGYELADRIAAIAAVAGTLPKDATGQLKPVRPVPVLYIHGTEDKLIGIDGTDFLSKRNLSLSANAYIEWWAKNNGCAERPKVELLPDAAKDGTQVKRTTFADRNAKAPVIYYEITGGGHTWPSGFGQPEVLLGKTSQNLKATQVMWEFFSQYSLPEKPKP